MAVGVIMFADVGATMRGGFLDADFWTAKQGVRVNPYPLCKRASCGCGLLRNTAAPQLNTPSRGYPEMTGTRVEIARSRPAPGGIPCCLLSVVGAWNMDSEII